MAFNRTSPEMPLDTSIPCVVICPGYHGHGVARSLGRLGVNVYGVHADPRSPSACSRYWQQNFYWDLAQASTDESVDWFLSLARKIGFRPILIPTDDDSCLFVDENAPTLHQEYLFPEQPAGLSQSLSNKKRLYSLCKEKEVLTPATQFPQSRNDVVELIEDARFPVVLKGIDPAALQQRVGVRMVIAEDADTLLSSYDKMETPDSPNLMLQEYVPGTADNVWMFNGYFDGRSRCLFGITGRKLRQYPAYTGMTSLGVCESNEAVADLTQDFATSVGYRGILDIGYKYDAHRGQYYLLDPNPRLGRTFRLFVDSRGMDVVRALYCDLTGQPVRVGQLVQGRKWLAEAFDIVSSLRYGRDGNLGALEWIRSFRGVEESQWFARDDMGPFLIVWPRALQRSWDGWTDRAASHYGGLDKTFPKTAKA